MAHGLLCSNWVLLVSCMSVTGNTRTAETVLTACRYSLPFSHFWSVLLLLGTAGEYTVCVAVLMQCSHVRSIVTSLSLPLWSSQLISVSINFPSLPSSPLPFSPIPSPHCPTPPLSPPSPPLPFSPIPSPHCPTPLSLSSPSHPHLPFPSVPSPQNMFQTLKYLALLGVPTFIAGNRLLRKIAQARK